MSGGVVGDYKIRICVNLGRIVPFTASATSDKSLTVGWVNLILLNSSYLLMVCA